MSTHQLLGQLLDTKIPASIEQYEAGDIILDYLRELGVEYVFGIPGGAIEPLFNALARSAVSHGPKPITARHETGAAFMADGYARETGKLGVCIATSGPGATNLITGIASSYLDRVPLLVITGQPSIDTFGGLAFQESSCSGIDIVAMLKHCTAYSSLVSHPDQLERKLIAAITAAYQNRQPVHLSIPTDIARSVQQRSFNRRLLPKHLKNNTIDLHATEELAQRLYKARNPVFVIGENCENAARDIITYCENNNISLVTTPQGKGLINPYHSNYYGVCGLAAHESATTLLNSPKTDLIVIVGSSLDQQAACGWQPSNANHTNYIHIDCDSEHFCRSPFSILNVSGNIKRIFEYLNNSTKIRPKNSFHQMQNASIHITKPIPFERRELERRKQNTLISDEDYRANQGRRQSTTEKPLFRNFQLIDELKYLNDSSPIKPQRLMYELSHHAKDGTCFLADIGSSYLWAIHYLNPYHQMNGGNTRYLHMAMGLASMAWSIGAAIGIALASPQKSIICIVGDGALLMSGHEITVAVQHKLPIIYIVLNDEAYGMVKHGQKIAGAELTSTDLPAVKFADYAQSIGAKGITAESLQDFTSIDLKSLSESDLPTLIDVHIDKTEAPPLSSRLKMLASYEK
ncbi:MAG: thiamine pyrophosphate-binding protein [Flavobacteriales bacterium]|nr:thiamine pyrophosphate-binding protein [Flavobacteriales bacterium]